MVAKATSKDLERLTFAFQISIRWDVTGTESSCGLSQREHKYDSEQDCHSGSRDHDRQSVSNLQCDKWTVLSDWMLEFH